MGALSVYYFLALSLLLKRKIQGINGNPNALSQDSIEKLCLIYTMIDKDILIAECLKCWNNFTEIESSVQLPKIHDDSFISCKYKHKVLITKQANLELSYVSTILI